MCVGGGGGGGGGSGEVTYRNECVGGREGGGRGEEERGRKGGEGSHLLSFSSEGARWSGQPTSRT